MRRGEYAKLDASRLLPGEWAIVLSGDSAATDGRSVYVCFAAGATKKLVTVEDFASLLADSEPDAAKAIVDAASAVIDAAEAARRSAESTRQSQESTRQSNERTRQSNESTRQSNESTRKSNETARQSAESARVSADKDRETRQKANDDTAAGWKYHVCTSSEYSASNLHNVPSLTASVGVVYLTPKLTGATSWCQYDHWIYVGSAWELLNDTSNMASYYFSSKPAESAVPSKPSVVYVSDGSSYIVADDLSASAKAAPAWDEEEAKANAWPNDEEDEPTEGSTSTTTVDEAAASTEAAGDAVMQAMGGDMR